MKRRDLLALAGLAFGAIAQAEPGAWPDRPVRFIAPFAPSSTPDTLARVLTQRLQERLKQPFTVDNRPGAGGMIGTDAVAKAAPDGTTFGISIVGPLVNNRELYRHMPYDPERDLAPVTIAVNQPSLLVVRSELGVADLAQLIAELKKHPGGFNYASIGNGSVSHLTMELIALRTGTSIVHVPYAGSGQATLAVMSGEVQMACLPAQNVLPQVKAGKLRVLGVSTARRSSLMPEVPTLKEQGLGDLDAGAWMGVIAPARTPRAIVDRLNREIVAVLNEPAVADTLRGQMMEVVAGTPEAMAAFLREEAERWTPVIRRNHIRLD